MTFSSKFLGFAMLWTLFVSGEFRHVLVSDNKNRRIICHTLIDMTADICSKIRCFVSMNSKFSSKYYDFSEEISLGVSIALNGFCFIMVRLQLGVFSAASHAGETSDHLNDLYTVRVVWPCISFWKSAMRETISNA
jgi:hypothetical protein